MSKGDETDSTTWRQVWLECIQEFSNYHTQRATWLNSGPPNPHYNPHFSFREFLASYFDVKGELRGGFGARVAEGDVTQEEAEAVAPFHALLDAYEPPNGDDQNHEAILSDMKWVAVVEAAMAARDRLAAMITDPAEGEGGDCRQKGGGI
jgi:hypothetical protein